MVIWSFSPFVQALTRPSSEDVTAHRTVSLISIHTPRELPYAFLSSAAIV
jgi:hypothetical protein